MHLEGALLFGLQVAFNHPAKPSEDPRAGAEPGTLTDCCLLPCSTTERNKNGLWNSTCSGGTLFFWKINLVSINIYLNPHPLLAITFPIHSHAAQGYVWVHSPRPLGSLLMSVTHIATKAMGRPEVCFANCGHFGVRLRCHYWDHVGLGRMCCYYGTWWHLVQTAARGHDWVQSPASARVWVDVHGACYHQGQSGCLGSGQLPETQFTKTSRYLSVFRKRWFITASSSYWLPICC